MRICVHYGESKTGKRGLNIMAKVGRPKSSFDWDLVESLSILEASEVFIAERLLIKEGVNPDKKSIAAKVKLIQRRIEERYGYNFVQYKDQKVETKRIKLRQSLFKAAENGNISAMIWLSKQYLGMSDKQEIQQSTSLSVDMNKFKFVEPKE